MNMNEEELKLFTFLTKGKIKDVYIDHQMGMVCIALEDGISIDIIGGEDEVTVEYSGNFIKENLKKYFE